MKTQLARLRRAALAAALLPACAIGAEGMWTLDNLPLDALERQYGFKPDQAWIDHAMRSAVRLAGGCSGSFVSPDGLVLTNHHCVVGCVQDLSSKDRDLVGNGFLARARDQELQCPGMEINRLEAITDVTERIRKATEGLSGEAYNAAKKAAQTAIEAECAGDQRDRVRCDVVELYQGGLQHLYRYSRFQDVRLVFVPEYATGFFGGDPDNFNFPRYNLDMALLRVWQDGSPLAVSDYFAIDAGGAEPGELVMTLGHPGSTQRLLTMAQLETLRDVVLPFRLMLAHEFRGMLLRFVDESEEHARIAKTDLTFVENGIKARSGMFRALLNAEVMAAKRADEQALRDWVQDSRKRRQRYGDPWREIAQAQRIWRDLYVEYAMVESGYGFYSDYLSWARTLVRAAAERGKPDGERLREYAEARLPAVRARLLADTPVYPEYERMKLAWSLSKLREKLGTDHPFVREVLGKDSPEVVAARIVEGSELGKLDVRRALWEGGAEAIAASQDPAIVLARRIDPYARALRKRYEDEVESVERRGAERLAQARFARYGTSVYPDATFSLRLSYGDIRGWVEKGRPVPPFTTFEGLYARATEYPPYRLAPSWVEARSRLDMATRFNQVSTNDIIGGNSGSPLIDAGGRIVGLIFDGNIHSLGGAFFYDEQRNRAVSVHPAAMIEALDKVYGARHLIEELKIVEGGQP